MIFFIKLEAYSEEILKFGHLPNLVVFYSMQKKPSKISPAATKVAGKVAPKKLTKFVRKAKKAAKKSASNRMKK
jgi:hypothetical protein